MKAEFRCDGIAGTYYTVTSDDTDPMIAVVIETLPGDWNFEFLVPHARKLDRKAIVKAVIDAM